MNIVKDIFGNIIVPGTLVACSALRRRSAELRVGIVSGVSSSYITVTRVSTGYNGKFSHRKNTCYGSDVIVLRWDMLKEESTYYKYLNELKIAIMKQ